MENSIANKSAPLENAFNFRETTYFDVEKYLLTSEEWKIFLAHKNGSSIRIKNLIEGIQQFDPDSAKKYLSQFDTYDQYFNLNLTRCYNYLPSWDKWMFQNYVALFTQWMENPQEIASWIIWIGVDQVLSKQVRESVIHIYNVITALVSMEAILGTLFNKIFGIRSVVRRSVGILPIFWK